MGRGSSLSGQVSFWRMREERGPAAHHGLQRDLIFDDKRGSATFPHVVTAMERRYGGAPTVCPPIRMP